MTTRLLPVNQAKFQAQLARLHNRQTLYELVITHDEDTSYLLQYCSHSRQSLLKAARKHGIRLAALTGVETLQFASRASEGATLGTWTIHWTGRTHREAIIQGEYPFIAE